MKKHVIKICQSAYFELKHVSSVHRFFIEDAIKTRLTSYVNSQLGYCNCFLIGAPISVIQPLQKVQNFATRHILMAPHHHHSMTVLRKLHWLLISECVKYQVACMCFYAVNGSSPTYLELWTAAYRSALCLACFTHLLISACSNSDNINARLVGFILSLTLGPLFHRRSGKIA